MPASISAMTSSATSEAIIGPAGTRRLPSGVAISAAVQPSARSQGREKIMYQMPWTSHPTIQAIRTATQLIGGMVFSHLEELELNMAAVIGPRVAIFGGIG